MKVIKKDKTLEEYDEQKIINAVNKSAQRALVNLSREDYSTICNRVFQEIEENDYFEEDWLDDIVPVEDIHSIVEGVLLELYPKVGQQYQQYRNYKLDFAEMLDDIYTKSQGIRYIGDVSKISPF